MDNLTTRTVFEVRERLKSKAEALSQKLLVRDMYGLEAEKKRLKSKRGNRNENEKRETRNGSGTALTLLINCDLVLLSTGCVLWLLSESTHQPPRLGEFQPRISHFTKKSELRTWRVDRG